LFLTKAFIVSGLFSGFTASAPASISSCALAKASAFVLCELNGKDDLKHALSFGLLPLIYQDQDPRDNMATYIGLYIREEVQAEGLVRKIGDFNRFLETISLSHGSLLNISNVARDCQVERRVVENYTRILEDLLLAERIPVFTKRAKRETISHPKFYLFDAGVFRHIRPTGPMDSPYEIEGAALEGLVYQHLKAWIAYRKSDLKIYYWRTRRGLEVDFILYGSEGLYAIEVKRAENFRDNDLKALRAFKEDYPPTKQIFLSCSNEKYLINGVNCLPCEYFLKNLHPDKTIDEIIDFSKF